jgi:hypothetical protein
MLVIGVAVLVVAIAITGVVAWVVSQNDGGDRTAYCNLLREATNDGDVTSVLDSVDPGVLDRLADQAPDTVAGDWAALIEIRDNISSGADPDTGVIVKVMAAVTHIVDDAASECGLTLDVPLL